MSHQFKPGDLALMINCGSSNDFKTVELVECIGSPAVYKWRDGSIANRRRDTIWIVRSINDPIVLSRAALEYFDVDEVYEAPCAERRLMPLRGDFEPEQQKSKEAEPCV